jgi:hypothetical protein
MIIKRRGLQNDIKATDGLFDYLANNISQKLE